MARKMKTDPSKRAFDARPDRADFRDHLYEPGLHYVPPTMPLAAWQKKRVVVLDQGEDGACTGHGLACVANMLLGAKTESASVSAWMMYEIAKKYDEWPGQDYEGSSCKGAVKGWHRHGVCALNVWKKGQYSTTEKLGKEPGIIVDEDAAKRPLGAYRRVNAKDLAAIHAAIAEVGALFASGDVHDGWWEPQSDGSITWPSKRAGGHAFAIVGYDEIGFWIQNSWGVSWGIKGCARLSYDDWLANGFDAWAVRLGVPMLVAK